MSSQCGSQKLLQGLVSHELTAYLSVFDLFLTRWTMAILSKWCKPGNFEPHNSLKCSFTNIQGLHSNFVDSESFLESSSLDIPALCQRQTWILNWFWQLLCERLSSINRKGFYNSYAWSCSLCEGWTTFCMGLISRKLSRFLLMFLAGFTSLCRSSLYRSSCLS